MLTFLPKTETKELLGKETTPVVTYVIGYKSWERDRKELIRLQQTYGNLLAWFLRHGLTTSDTQKAHIEKMSSLLGACPSHSAILGSDRYRNAIWGLKWEGNKALLFLSIKGFQLEVDKDFDATKIEEFLNYLASRILEDN